MSRPLHATVIGTYLVEIMGSICLGLVDPDDNSLNLVPTRPLHVARMLIDPPDVLPHFRVHGIQDEGIDRVQRVGEDEFGPSEDPELVTCSVEVVPASQFV